MGERAMPTRKVSATTTVAAAAEADVGLAAANLQSSEAVYRQIVGNNPGRLSNVKGVEHLVPGSISRGMEIAALGANSFRTRIH